MCWEQPRARRHTACGETGRRRDSVGAECEQAAARETAPRRRPNQHQRCLDGQRVREWKPWIWVCWGTPESRLHPCSGEEEEDEDDEEEEDEDNEEGEEEAEEEPHQQQQPHVQQEEASEGKRKQKKMEKTEEEDGTETDAEEENNQQL